MAAPALSYMPAAVTALALAAFRHVLPPGDDTPWFVAEVGGPPLRWHLPIGVLADAAGVAPGDGPWRLTLHLRHPPTDAPGVLPWHGTDPARDAYLNAVKEAAAATAGSAARIVSLAPARVDALWRAAAAGDAASTAAAITEAGVAPVERTGRGKCVPVRVVLARGARGTAAIVAALSAPAAVARPEGTPVTVAEAVVGLLATAAPSTSVGEWQVRPDGTSVGRVGAPDAVATIVGVPAPLGEPVEWAHSCLAACDQFLYVVVRED